MTEEIINNIESNNDTEEQPIKKETRGRKKLPDELRKVYVPHPRVIQEKPPKETKPPREKKVKSPKEPFEPLKRGRKTGTILNPDRHNEHGTYNYGPLEKDYYKNYYREVLRKPCTCNICGVTIASKSKLKVHQNSRLCRLKKCMADIPSLESHLEQLQNSMC